MSAFEFLFSFYGLLLGLTLSELVSGFSRALDARDQRPMGMILPMLTAVLIFLIAAQWGAAWRDYREVEFDFRFLVGAALTTLAYYFSATQMFPRDRSEARSLDEHFFSHRRAILGGVLFSYALLTTVALSKQWGINGADAVFWTRIAANAFWSATMLAALVARSPRVIVTALAANLVFSVYWFVR